MNRVRIRLLTRKETPSNIYREGEIFEAHIRSDMYAVINLGAVFKPDEYEIFFSEADYWQLLTAK